MTDTTYGLTDPQRMSAATVKSSITQHITIENASIVLDMEPGQTIVIYGVLKKCSIKAPAGSLVAIAPSGRVIGCELDIHDLLVEGEIEANIIARGDVEFTSSAIAIGQCQRGGRLLLATLAKNDQMQHIVIKATSELMSSAVEVQQFN